MPTKATVGLVSLGCPKNLVDSQAMLGLLDQAGYALVEEVEDAEVIIVNSCAFIEPAEEEAIDALLDLADLKRNHCRALICAGCLPERYKEGLLAELPEVDGFVGVGGVPRIVEAVGRALEGERFYIDGPLTYVYDGSSPWVQTGPEWTAYLKISDGCNHRCTFCTIPSIRGPYRSVAPEAVLDQYRRMVESGIGEIILVGQDTSAYGRDLAPRKSLSGLLGRLAGVEYDGWLRLLYLYPQALDEATIARLCSGAPFVPYFDIPLQHAAPKILRAMARPGTAESYLELIGDLRRHDPAAAIRTTFIVGFPGETDDDFELLLDFVREARLDRLSVFRYWDEPGTKAAELPDQVPIELADERLDELMQVQEDISLAVNESLVGQRLRVLLEREEVPGELWCGRSYRDAPEIDAEVKVTVAAYEGVLQPGDFLDVEVEKAEVHDVRGRIVTALD